MQLKALTSAALLAGAQALVAPGASKPALALRAEEVEAAPVEVAPVAEAAPEAEVVAPVAEVAAVAPEPVLTSAYIKLSRRVSATAIIMASTPSTRHPTHG